MDINKYKILIVDDEQDILEFVSYNLKKEGFQVYTSNNGRNAIELAREVKPHLILLDIMMPEMDGIETCEKIRDTPEIRTCIIAFLTARSEDYSQIAGFEAGGDDYISKPIKPKLLISRLKALLKRLEYSNGETHEVVKQKTLGNIVIDIDRYVVMVGELEIYLPKKEFNLLQLLTSRPSKVFTREEIFDYIWGDDTFVGDRTIDVYIRKLREKLGDNLIKTIKGVGYKFEYPVQ
ncbi:MAG: response regulator transcription factor [Bacteroidales bacterium]|nr:response regulator transcription factor [Bacteroidales bacterium]